MLPDLPEQYFLTVRELHRETVDATTVVFDVPEHAREAFAYLPGQFLTLAVPSDQTGLVARNYTIAAGADEQRIAVTVKRTPGGYASNWINDRLAVGDTLRVLPPSGTFTPKTWDTDLLLFGGGSGITPLYAIARTMLRHHHRRVVLCYANRDPESVIFADRWHQLAEEYPDRLRVVHWLESVAGLPSAELVRGLAAEYPEHTAFVCGPAPFMKLVMGELRELGIPRERRFQEKFVSLGGNPFGDVPEVRGPVSPEPLGDTAATPGPVDVEVLLEGQEHRFSDWDGHTPLLDFLLERGVAAPYSCREGHCSACACRVVEGDLRLRHNDVLEPEDLAAGIRLVCQAEAGSPRVRISYDG